jgi:glycine cleavage system H protein
MAKAAQPKRPRDLKFSETHEWVRVEGQEAVVGISDYAVGQLSDLVSVDLPKVGEAVEIETPMGEIESVKTVAELVSPLNGKIAAVNQEVADNVDLLANSPYDEGWLVRIKMKDPKDVDHLMSAKEYDEYLDTLKEEAHNDEDKDDEKDSEDDEEEDEEEEQADDEGDEDDDSDV